MHHKTLQNYMQSLERGCRLHPVFQYTINVLHLAVYSFQRFWQKTVCKIKHIAKYRIYETLSKIIKISYIPKNNNTINLQFKCAKTLFHVNYLL